MKLRNKKTGEIVEFRYLQSDYVAPLVLTTYENDKPEMYSYNSLAELNEEWEDYEEPEEYWFINDLDGKPMKCELRYCPVRDFTDWIVKRKQIGNYFESREEAEKAVRKLEAWKLLKDMGFKIEGIRFRNNKSYIEWTIPQKTRDDHFMSEAFNEALHLLFGGEE